MIPPAESSVLTSLKRQFHLLASVFLLPSQSVKILAGDSWIPFSQNIWELVITLAWYNFRIERARKRCKSSVHK